MFVVPSLHPSFLLHNNRRLSGVVQHDLERAISYARGARPQWSDDGFITFPKLETVRSVLRRMRGKKVAFDIETNGKHPLICDIRCIGFYDGSTGISIPLLYRDGSTIEVVPEGKVRPVKVKVWKPYYGESTKVVLEEIRKLLEDKATTFYAQNGQYDCLCLRNRLDIKARYDFDSILAHHVVASYMAHSLAFLTSIYTDRPYYKSTEDGDAWSSVSDLDLAIYNTRDCAVTWTACERLKDEIKERPEDSRIYEYDHWYAQQCERWKEVGIAVDRDALEKLRAHYTLIGQNALVAMREVIGSQAAEALREEIMEDLTEEMDAEQAEAANREVYRVFSPGSLIRLRKVLAQLGVPLTQKTDTGAISTAAEFLIEARRIVLDTGAKPDDPRIAFLDYLFAWREATKLVSTFLTPNILPDGRIHPTYSVHVTPTGRLASKGPNAQNMPKPIRAIYVPSKGHKLVSGDVDSGELRVIGYIANEPGINKAFADFDEGKGPKFHKLNCNRIFGVPLDADFDSPKVAPLYRAGKAVIYGVNYGAGVKTAYEAARKEMPDLKFEHFQLIYNQLKRAYPTLFEWQKNWTALGMRQGYLDSPILKRRVYFFEKSYGDVDDSPEAAAMLNLPCQSSIADLVVIANRRLMEEVVEPARRKLRRGEMFEQIAQVHDELLFEVPERMAEKFAKDFKRVVERPPDEAHRHWRIPWDVKVIDRWAKLKIEEPKQ